MDILIPWWGRALAMAALAAAIWGHGYVSGGERVERALEALRVKDAAEAIDAVTEAARMADRIVYRYIDRTRIIRERGQDIAKEVRKNVTPTDDASCIVPDGFIQLLNAAASVPAAKSAAGSVNGASASVSNAGAGQ